MTANCAAMEWRRAAASRMVRTNAPMLRAESDHVRSGGVPDRQEESPLKCELATSGLGGIRAPAEVTGRTPHVCVEVWGYIGAWTDEVAAKLGSKSPGQIVAMEATRGRSAL